MLKHIDQMTHRGARAKSAGAAAALALAGLVCLLAAHGRAADETPADAELVCADGVALKLKLIMPGKFRMGDDNGHADEKPARTVTITKPFLIGVYEVTQAQFEAVMGSNPSHFKGPDKPVERVTWTEADEFCRRLSAKTGRTVRLPTEAEWEYACRAGTRGAFSCAADAETLKKHCWCSYEGRMGSARGAKPVGSLAPNPWGLYDMHGNVWEWCSDWYDYYRSASPVDPRGPRDTGVRVCRGGGWYARADLCASATRGAATPDERDSVIGFRVVCDAAAGPQPATTR